jgi:sarcosine oxidase
VSQARPYDVVVVGVGAMGSAAAFHLARRGVRVLAVDRHAIPNTMGSSHGISRIIRLAYAEDPSYVPLLRRAYALWHELETFAGERLLVATGSIDAAREEDWMFSGSVRSCVEHDLEHEVLEPAEVARRWPGYRLPDGILSCYQPDGGFLLAERCVVAHARAAMAHGAELHGHERVLGLEDEGELLAVVTDRGRHLAERVVLAAGAWMGELADPLAGLAVPERQVLGWFATREPAQYRPDTFPVFNLATDLGRYYGFPEAVIPGFKIGRYHHREEVVVPDGLDRTAVDGIDEHLLREAVSAYFPGADGPTLTLATCLFTNTPDEHFVIDRHPADDRVVLASPCSGHGFKFASVVGEVLADLATDGSTRHPIDLFGLDRLTAGASA